jgi:hypothetical protein
MGRMLLLFAVSEAFCRLDLIQKWFVGGFVVDVEEEVRYSLRTAEVSIKVTRPCAIMDGDCYTWQCSASIAED